MGKRAFFFLGTSVLATAVGIVTACTGDDPASVVVETDGGTPDATAPPNPGIDGATDGNTAPSDASSDGAVDAAAEVDGAVAFALHLPQNLGSPPFAAVTFDAAGNALAGMNFNVTTSLGAKTLTPPGGGSHDVGIIKLSPTGDPIWMVAFGGTGDDTIASIATDAAGDVYAVGVFNSATLGGTSLTHRGNSQYDTYVVKLSGVDGSVLDAVDLVSTTGNGGCTAVAVRGTRLAVGCTITGTASVRDAAGMDVDRAPVHVGSSNVFIAMLSTATLREAWSLSIGGSDRERLGGLALGPTGDVFAAGSFESSAFATAGGAVSIPRKSTGGAGIGDAFAIRLAAATGVPLWGKGYGSGDASSNHAFVQGVAVTSAGDPVLVGALRGALPFGGQMAGASDGGTGDAFAARLHATDGATAWVRNFGGDGFESALAVAPDLAGGVYVTGGYFSAGLKFDGVAMPDPLATTSNLFSVRLDAAGSVQWAYGVTTASSTTFTQASAAAGDPVTGGALFAGTFKGFVNLGDAVPVSSHLDAGGYDLFIIKRRP